MGRRSIIIVFSLLISSSCFANESMAYKLKALYILRIADFISWPNLSDSRQFTVCINAKDPVAMQLQKMQVPTVKSLPLVVMDLTNNTSLEQCHIAYFSKGQRKPTYTPYPVLTLSSKLSFAEQGGMVEFYLEKDKVKMKANLLAVNKVGIKFSSKLIRLMQLVTTVDDK